MSSYTSSAICSQGVIMAAAMVLSSTIIFLAFSREKERPPKADPVLRSCLYSEKKRRERKKKKVCFAGNVKDSKGNGEEYRREQRRKKAMEMETRKVDNSRICRNQMPANRIALYDGILRDRIHRIQSSY